MLKKFAGIAAVSIFALAGANAANASCEGRTTTGTVVGAGAGGVLGNVVTHGSAVGTIGGAVVGGVAGHEIGRNGCRSHYYRSSYYRHHHHHYYRAGYHHHDRGYYDRYGRWHDYD